MSDYEDYPESDIDQSDYPESDIYQSDYPESNDEDSEWGQDEIKQFDMPSIKVAYDQLQHTIKQDLCGDYNEDIIQLKKNIQLKPDEYFKKIVGILCKEINRDTTFMIDFQTRNRLCNIVGQIPRVQVLNPTAFIIGYLVTDYQGNIIESELTKAFGQLYKLRDTSVLQPDVVRYARFWKNKQYKIL